MGLRSETTSWNHLKPFLPSRSHLRLAVIGLTSFLGSLAESAVLVILTLTADSLIRNRNEVVLAGFSIPQRIAVLLAIGLLVSRVAMALTTAAVSARFSTAVMKRAQGDLLAAYLQSSHEARRAHPLGDLATVTVSHGRFTGDLAAGFATVAASICGLLAFGGTSLVVNPFAAVGIAGAGLVVLALIRPLRRRSRASAWSYSESSRTVGQETTEIEALHREIEVFRVASPVLRRIVGRAEHSAEELRGLRFYSSAIPPIFQSALLAAAVLSLLLLIGSAGGDSLASVGAVVLLLIRSMTSAQQLVMSNQKVLELSPYAGGLSKLIRDFQEKRPQRGNERPAQLLPLDLRDVGFTYDGTTPVLSDLRLTFSDGELVGVVGPSGAGKSTLVELVLGLRLPTSGEILCGDVELSRIDPNEFARRVAFVPQDPVLITGTVAENVDLFRGLPEEQIRTAIRAAHLSSEIEALPDGIHTRLGPHDRSLSGGQRQRLIIARALAGRPEILILDEPSSALDPISEDAIRRTIAQVHAGRLVIVIAHRYSTLRSCTRILAIADGRLEVDAQPEQVAARSGFFRAMIAGDVANSSVERDGASDARDGNGSQGRTPSANGRECDRVAPDPVLDEPTDPIDRSGPARTVG